MELDDYIMKFPAYWRGVFAPLSKDHSPVIGAQTWLLEKREGAHTLHMGTAGRHASQIDWVGFIDALCEFEPVENSSCLIFLPRILLFPVNIQRNTFAFLCEHLSEVPVGYLDRLLRVLMTHQPTDDWIKLHLRKIQDYVCWKQCQHFGTGFCADDQISKLTKASWITFTNVCEHIRDKDKNFSTKDAASQLEFDWLPEALTTNPRECKHRDCFAAEVRVTTEKRKMISESSQHDPMEGIEGSAVKRRREEEGRSTPDVIIIDQDSQSPMDVGAGNQEEGTERVDSEDLFKSQSTTDKEGARSKIREMGEDRSAANRLHDNGKDPIDAVTKDTLTAMKLRLSDPKAAETIPPDQLKVLIDCPSHHLEARCDVLELDSIPAASLTALANQLTRFSMELSHLSAVVLARRCFLNQILALNQTAPRALISAVVNLAKAIPKPTIEGALIPALTEEGHGGVAAKRCDLVAKVVKEGLTNEGRVHLLDKIFSVAKLQWSENLTTFFQTLVDCKLELNAECLEAFIAALEHHCSSKKSCAKFAKLLLTVINRFSKQVSPSSLVTLQRLVDANQTFFKKRLIAALKLV